MAVRQGSPPPSFLEAAAGAEMRRGGGLVGQKLIHRTIYRYFLLDTSHEIMFISLLKAKVKKELQ